MLAMTMKSEKSNHSRFTLWQLSHIATALTRAKRLEKERAAFHADLYASVRYPTVHYDREFTGTVGSPATDIQAIRIIEAKERYERLIQQEYSRHERWIRTLDRVNEKEKIILRRYFQQNKKVEPKILNAVLDRMSKDIEKDEMETAAERDKIATERHRAYRKMHPERFKEAAKVEKDKKQYFVDGRFVYMTPEEYEEYKQQEEERFNLWNVKSD